MTAKKRAPGKPSTALEKADQPLRVPSTRADRAGKALALAEPMGVSNPSVVLVAPDSTTVTVTSLQDFYAKVYTLGYTCQSGSLHSNYLILKSAPPVNDPNEVLRLSDVTNSASAARVALKAALGASLQVVAGRDYRVVAGALRNDGAPNYWQLISDTDHRPQNIDSITTGTTVITVDYTSLAATKIASFVVVPDETLARAGFFCGASVTRSQATIRFGRARTIADYVSWNGTAFTSSSGVFTPSWASGRLTLTHEDLTGAASNAFDVSVTPRGLLCPTPVLAADVPASTTSTVVIEFRDSSGAQLTTPTTDWKIYVSRGATSPTTTAEINPQVVDTTKFPTSDLWFVGVFEVA